MADAIDRGGMMAERSAVVSAWDAALKAAQAAGPPLLFGLRLWASVCLALYVAFWLELDNAYWAGTSAALVCQPHLGASMRKGWFRMIGTVVGAVFIVVLSAVFPQDRAGFLTGLALWAGACAVVATLLRNFAAYAAALAGYTAAIVASDELGATGGTNGEVFIIAMTRVTEIWIGIACAGIVLAGTDFGDARRRLAALFAALSAEIASRFNSSLALAGSALSDLRPVRREFIRQVIALDPVIDEAIGESATLRHHRPALIAAVGGLFDALAAWRTIAARLMRLPDEAARRDADALLRSVPAMLRSAAQEDAPASWLTNPMEKRRQCDSAVRMLIATRASTPSLRLLANQIARVLIGLSHVLDALALLLRDPARPRYRRRPARFHIADWLPALVNGGRAFVTIGAAAVFWIITQWPNGAQAMTFTAIGVILFAPRAEEAYARTMSFMVGTGLAAVAAAVILLAVLPNVETFAGFSIVLGLFLVPVGALMAQPWQAAMFVPMAGNFVPLLGPANQMSYDSVQFYNAALAIVAGCGAAALSFQLLPPLSPALRARRLLAATLRDLRRLATEPVPRPWEDWKARMYSRLSALPEQAEPLQRARLLAALSIGSEIIHLRRSAPRLSLGTDLAFALAAFAEGDSAAATARFTGIDRQLAALGNPPQPLTLRARGRILAICDALGDHRSYFDQGAPA